MEYKEKYYLYYMGTTAPDHITDGPSGYSPDWWEYRNRQQIGVAVAESPNGPWTRFDLPVLAPSRDIKSWDSLLITNPSVCADISGRIIMVYKSVKYTDGNMRDRQGPVKHLAAYSESPPGPFIKIEKPIFTNPQKPSDDSFIAEHPFIWYSKSDSRFMAVVRDIEDVFSGEADGLALFESKNGLNDWAPSEYPIVLKSSFKWEDGTQSVSRVERPWLMFDEDGKPVMLCGATRLSSGDECSNSANVMIPLKLK